MKMFNKSECEYKSGYIVKGDEIVNIDNRIVGLFNKLEEDLQRSIQASKIEPVEEPKPFERWSEYDECYPQIYADTPELDEAIDKTIKIINEIDTVNKAEKANDYIQAVLPLFTFVDDEFIVSSDQPRQMRFDLPVIGNPLDLTKESLGDLVMKIFK